ncbi:sulfate reduction electron transfer complex DsrMKJOP subunit DsrO [Candidatus Venteria ishoeyi]|uniref:Tetrathionate reductase subunit B n=1 Tax=Candidatus Venteria ishoeyi TaxID=1899563 RepID=A0A1H6FFG8_9GAMM|nr:4Fe-4S dicluster domain-containing protein [Candidatus Venteria ishoeyi]MDM8547561.1 4Fe-4S dicluster domain-containing protein [Candidatus Venteria ishoeyi]SEH08383.1 Tetrathionate reductase subunit B precursor [Candidatus Venteria ishoeyi]
MTEQTASPKTENEVNRREFLSKGVAIAAGTTLAPGLFLHQMSQAKTADEAVSDKVRWGILIDANKCADDCSDCVQACNETYGLSGHERPATDAQWIRKVTVKDRQTGHVTSLPLMCQHCENPPCVDVCPTGASFKRENGIVLVDKHICIGCRYCMMACPYKARSFIHETLEDQKAEAPRGKGTVEACTFCVTRIDQGEETTACAQACKHEAMLFGDLNDPDSALSKRLKDEPSVQLRADLELNPGVRYQGL